MNNNKKVMGAVATVVAIGWAFYLSLPDELACDNSNILANFEMELLPNVKYTRKVIPEWGHTVTHSKADNYSVCSASLTLKDAHSDETMVTNWDYTLTRTDQGGVQYHLKPADMNAASWLLVVQSDSI